MISHRDAVNAMQSYCKQGWVEAVWNDEVWWAWGGPGMTALKATTAGQVQRALPGLEEQVECNPDSFQDFCTFAFKYCLTVCHRCQMLCSLVDALLHCVSEGTPGISEFKPVHV